MNAQCSAQFTIARHGHATVLTAVYKERYYYHVSRPSDSKEIPVLLKTITHDYDALTAGLKHPDTRFCVVGDTIHADIHVNDTLSLRVEFQLCCPSVHASITAAAQIADLQEQVAYLKLKRDNNQVKDKNKESGKIVHKNKQIKCSSSSS